MPRSSKGRLSGMMRRPAPPPAPRPVAQAPPPAVPQRDEGGSLLGGIGSTIAQGMAFGTGSVVADRAVDAVIGPRGGGAAPAAAAPEPLAASSPFGGQTVDACANQAKAFQDCLEHNNYDIGKCQFYIDMLTSCRRNETMLQAAVVKQQQQQQQQEEEEEEDEEDEEEEAEGAVTVGRGREEGETGQYSLLEWMPMNCSLAGFAFLFSFGLGLQVLGCALWNNWWPMLTALMYIMVPMPCMFFGGGSSSDFFSVNSYGNEWEDAAKFLTGFSAVGSIAIPAILHHASMITVGAMILQWLSFAVLLLTVLLFQRWQMEEVW
ncbi:hypothetical protein CBR_g33919 [Chara braunii]|uniref:CHCH domain-containing protein n=1 Tax=Chara braunii TaxID=69332 RepID=A0A388LHK5_CHABU|nr:hypothetical protein CBR_g33919 [Chara braunii]|eukprot:GBG81741.1 hypothetical protein CBR_g33919 [Chara braunii]